jgi:hypothetical protein
VEAAQSINGNKISVQHKQEPGNFSLSQGLSAFVDSVGLVLSSPTLKKVSEKTFK